jgi:hypothetical protein
MSEQPTAGAAAPDLPSAVTPIAATKTDPSLIELYKVYADSMEKLVARRLTLNTFFVSLNTILLGGALVTAKSKEVVSLPLLIGGALALALAGVAISVAWRRLLLTYGIISKAKFQVIHRMEEQLVFKPFTDERELLDAPSSGYRSATSRELALPTIFALLYIVVSALTLALGLSMARMYVSGVPHIP